MQVTIVGMVRSVKESATKIEYVIDDMTGPPLDVRMFVDNDVSILWNITTTNLFMNVFPSYEGLGGGFPHQSSSFNLIICFYPIQPTHSPSPQG